jgi:hypothetical protein
MSNAEIQQRVNYLRKQATPVRVSSMVSDLRSHELSSVLESDVRSVVQPMIVTGKLSYTPGLKIKLVEAAE